jgi:tRNA pseudouridine38-40 synthase
MCRGIVGTLIQVGQGRIGAGDIDRILKTRDRRVAGMTAPAHGLVLWKVFYQRERKPRTRKSDRTPTRAAPRKEA